MKKAIHASLFHCASSKDKDYLHLHCPEGSDSWCRFKKDKANRANTCKHWNDLPLDVIKEIKPIFQRLSEDSLLNKCLDGKTQNQNKYLNGMVWERVPKLVIVRSEVLQLWVYDAVSHFNIRSQAAIKCLRLLELPLVNYAWLNSSKLIRFELEKQTIGSKRRTRGEEQDKNKVTQREKKEKVTKAREKRVKRMHLVHFNEDNWEIGLNHVKSIDCMKTDSLT